MDEKKRSRLYFIGKKDHLIQAKRMTVTLDGREILIIYHQRTFHAMDLQCYHAGSSLETGDIEEINNKHCIVCPKHKYRISLADGEGLYRAKNPLEENPTPRWYSKGIKQRVHKVMEVDEDIFVTLSNCPGWIESDYYQTETGRAELRNKEESEDGVADVNADEDF
ncbi:Rieske domain-containing protein-like [Pimephales promelas]|uniref:Rieske domain-containing protein-like n=1 Tax=Pimephales promelas TaxID=90988 RepID=UPI001955DB69|nr:Rieske domain-containing protein-like [Pimephales promelas]KAG1943570.1 Rieske domain-containing protein [Pimephales promelas]